LLGFVETHTENEKVLTPFLRSLLERGLDLSAGLLVVIDGGKGLRAAVRQAFQKRALVQRCVWHSVPRRAQTRRMRCFSPDRTSKSGSLGQSLAA
jgi:transposase-like protein